METGGGRLDSWVGVICFLLLKYPVHGRSDRVKSREVNKVKKKNEAIPVTACGGL
jgi:hypothetical protein